MFKKKKRYGPPFVMLEKATLDSKEWKQLSPPEMLVYIYIKKNYNGRNNGAIVLRYSELKPIFAPATISKGLKGLAAKGWVERTKFGGICRYTNMFKLTGQHDRIR